MIKFFFNRLMPIFEFKFEFKLPKKNQIIFLRDHNVDLFKKYIFSDEFSIINYPFSLNIPILIKSLFNRKSKSFYLNYLITFIEMSESKIIISFIDNHTPFYLLKKFFKDKKFISIQNGYRGGHGDFFDEKITHKYSFMKLSADYILTFNESTGKEFNKFIDSKIITIGSFRNNIFAISKKKYKNSLAFISSYAPSNLVISDLNEQIIFSREFFYAEEVVIKFLLEYCNKKSLDFYVIPRLKNDEVNNFLLSFDKNKVQILDKKNRYSNYQYINEFDYLVGTETTMTYEALSRRQKIAIFAIRGQLFKKQFPGIKTNNEQYNFFWPSKKSIEGNFWTHLNDNDSMTRVLDFVTNCTDEEWIEELDKINEHDNILYDFGNTKLKNLIDKIIME